jgi:hypothetical protein
MHSERQFFLETHVFCMMPQKRKWPSANPESMKGREIGKLPLGFLLVI